MTLYVGYYFSSGHSVVMGYWNASVGDGREGNCVGKYGLGKRNDRRQKLVDFCRKQEMVVTNTWFELEKEGHIRGRPLGMELAINWTT